MPRSAHRLVLALLVLVPSVGDATVQVAPSTERDSYWLGAGLGAGSEDFAAQINGSYQFGANLVSLRIASTAGLFDEELTDYGLLYGRATRAAGSRRLLSFAAGISVVDGCGGGGLGGCIDEPTVIGLPLELQLSYRPGRVLGVGLYGFANFNRRRSFGGVTLSFQLGRLR